MPPGHRLSLLAAAGPFGVSFLRAPATGLTNLQQTNALVWIMVALSAGGAIITFSFLVYSLWKFRDPKVRGRRYG